jgi:hypothetical protein
MAFQAAPSGGCEHISPDFRQMSTIQQPSASPVIQPVILAGGYGTRLWPLSRAGFPKQFLFQSAARRLAGLVASDIDIAPPLIVTSEEHRFLALDQLCETGIVSSFKTNGDVLEIKSSLGETLDHSTWCL